MIAATDRLEIGFERPEAMPIGRVFGAYVTEAKYETLNSLRTPALAIPFILIPAAVYFLFGIVMFNPGEGGGDYGPGLVNYLFTGFCVFAVMMPGIFSSATIALERDGNLHKLKRALPVPGGAYLVAKVLTSMCVTALALALVGILALTMGGITLSLVQLLVIWSVLLAGCLPFCAIGFLIGALASGSAAPAYGNLVFLPMMWLSGLFIPLPAFLEPWTVVWPAFHLNQLALGLAGVEEFSFLPPAIAAGALVGVTVLLGGIAVRRLARVG